MWVIVDDRVVGRSRGGHRSLKNFNIGILVDLG
jgi:hypothetical protein